MVVTLPSSSLIIAMRELKYHNCKKAHQLHSKPPMAAPTRNFCLGEEGVDFNFLWLAAPARNLRSVEEDFDFNFLWLGSQNTKPPSKIFRGLVDKAATVLDLRYVCVGVSC